MKFSTEETIGTDDQALVLAALERSVGAISLSVTRMGNELRAYGIGPSPRPVNGHNVTVFRVDVEGSDQTRVKVESEYLASALLDVSAQEPAVRDKVERALELARDEVAHYRWQKSRKAAAAGTAEASTEFTATAPPVQSTIPPGDQSSGGQPSNEAESRGGRQLAAFPTDALPRRGTGRPPEGTTASIRSGEMAVAPTVVQATRPAATEIPEIRRAETPSAARESLPLNRSAPMAPEPGPPWTPVGNHTERPKHASPPSSRRQQRLVRSWRALPVAVIVLILVAIAYMLGRWQAGVEQTPVPEDDAQLSMPVPDPGQVPVRPNEDLPGRALVRPQAQRPDAGIPLKTRLATESASSEADAGESPALLALPTDLSHRLELWAASMRSNDAAEQSAFYASHLDRYFLRTDVDHDVVVHDKQDYLRRGHRVDRFGLEDIRVQDETDSTARLRLIKHYVTQTGSGAPRVERLVRSEISLRKIDGTWKITSERDFR